MSPDVISHPKPAPDHAPLTKSQAARLSGLTGVAAADLTGLTVAEIAVKFRWIIDPNLLLFRQVCGQVVKTDPASGVQYPVPFATVQAEDTVCSLLGFFPIEAPWAWFFPFHCETEVIGSTTTDACGKFCIWIPLFEIEWILRFRLERVCYLELFTKPTVASVLNALQGNPDDPAPTRLTPNTALYQKAESVLGSAVARALATTGSRAALGDLTTSRSAVLARPAFSTPLAPPLPKALRKPAHTSRAPEHRAAVSSTLANQLGLDGAVLEGLDLGCYCGPFLRCYDILVPEWVPIFEVPDIGFVVTQDVTGTGTQQVIYSGGLFDAPWNANGATNVTLIASPIAVSTTNCNVPDVPCGDVPSLEFVGLMPLVNPPSPASPYVDPVLGYATRPNPPHPSGTLAGPALPPASAPYTGTLQLYGCTEVDGAVYYRLQYTYTAPGSSTPSALVPFKGLTWPLYREVGGVLETLTPTPDSNGWYPVLPASDGWFPASLVLEWDTTAFADGLYTVQLEVADASETLLAVSTTVGLMIDNAAPVVTWNAVWSFASDLSDPQPLPTNDCPVIDRGTTPQDIYIGLTFTATANHLREVQASAGGCASATLITPVTGTQHWYEDTADTSFSGSATYKIPASSSQGAYTFGVYADSRAFNPAGGDAGPLDDWNYNPVYIWVNPSFAISVVNENP